jgi:serine/threonine protein kinase
MIGKQILHYRIEKLLNKSSMSAIYLATNILDEKLVAVKVYNPFLVKGTRLARYLKSQMPLLTSLKQPNIVQVYQVVEQPEGICLIMEYVEGLTLGQYISKADREMTEEEITGIFLQILTAINYAHRHEVLHIDIKPSNILITKDKEVKVSFCSTARLLAADAPVLARAGFKIGNVYYKCPEQIYEKQTDARSDIYSAGVVLYELLTGRAPYTTNTHSEFEIQNMIVYEPLFKANELRQGNRGRMQALVNMATAKTPDLRFADVDDFIAAMQELQHEEREKQYQQMLREVSLNSAQLADRDTSSVIRMAEKQKRSRTIAGIYAVFALMAACFFIFTITYRYVSKTAGRAYASNISADSNSPEPGTEQETTDVQLPSVDTSQPSVPAAVTTVASANPAVLTEAELQYRLESYYKALQTKDTGQLAQYYAPSLIRFFNEYGVSDELLNQLLNQAWERTPEARYNILWETFRYSRDEKGNYVVDYYMNYHYRRANRKSWRVQKIYTMIKMNKDLQIYYITGD